MNIVTLPRTLHDITLEQHVGWYETYGNYLSREGKKQNRTPEEKLLFETDFYIKHYAWYSNTPLETVVAATEGEESQVVDIITESAASLASLYREMCGVDQLDVAGMQFAIGDDIVRIVAPVVVGDVPLTVSEFECVQTVSLIFSDIQEGKHTALYDLCAEYLRSTSDARWSMHTNPEWIKSIPLFVAMCVKKYVIDTISVYKALQHDRGTGTA